MRRRCRRPRARRNCCRPMAPRFGRGAAKHDYGRGVDGEVAAWLRCRRTRRRTWDVASGVVAVRCSAARASEPKFPWRFLLRFLARLRTLRERLAWPDSTVIRCGFDARRLEQPIYLQIDFGRSLSLSISTNAAVRSAVRESAAAFPAEGPYSPRRIVSRPTGLSLSAMRGRGFM